MGLARFFAVDPYRPTATENELDELLSEMDGVRDWTIHPDDEVTVEYDTHRISDELIEEALSGIGFQLKHVFDEPGADEAEVDQALAT